MVDGKAFIRLGRARGADEGGGRVVMPPTFWFTTERH
jgi:hypothetical protein